MENKKIKEIFTHLEPTILSAKEMDDPKVNIFFNEHRAAKKIIEGFINDFNEDDGQYNYEKNNIILIDGDRGSGKTSTLLTLKEYLKNQTDNTTLKKVYVIDRLIDPSMFINSENILKLIVASLFKDVENDDNFNSKVNKYDSTLLEDFNNIMEVLNYNVKEFDESIDMIESLSKCSNYYDAKELFSKLIDSFLKFKSINKKEYTSICIFIDDIDLNIKNSFEMLEQIRRYLKQKNIIIIMGIKKTSLRDVLINKYFSDFENIMKYNSSKKDNEKYFSLDDMSDDYLNKVFPINYNINLPNKEKLMKTYIEEFGLLLKNKLLLNVPNFNFDFMNGYLKNSLRENNQIYYSLKKLESIKFENQNIVIPNDTFLSTKLKDVMKWHQDSNNNVVYDYKDCELLLDMYLYTYINTDDWYTLFEIHLLISWLQLFDCFNPYDILKFDEIKQQLFIFQEFNTTEGSNDVKRYYLDDLYDIDKNTNFNNLFLVMQEMIRMRKNIKPKYGAYLYLTFLKDVGTKLGCKIKDEELYNSLNQDKVINFTPLNFINEDFYTEIIKKIDLYLSKKQFKVASINDVENKIRDSEYSDVLNDKEYRVIQKQYLLDLNSASINGKPSRTTIRTKMVETKLNKLKYLLSKERRNKAK